MSGAVDITQTFLGLVESLSTGDNRKPSKSSSSVSASALDHSKSVVSAAKNEIKAHRPLSPFIGSCKQVYDLLTGLDVFLKKNLLAYLQTSTTSTTIGITPMTERERQKLDDETDKSLKSCESSLSQLQAKISTQSKNSQLLDHRSRVLLHLWDIYGDVSAAYFKQKSARLETSLEERIGYKMNHQATLHATRAPRVLHDSPTSNRSPNSETPEILSLNSSPKKRNHNKEASSSNSMQSDYKRFPEDEFGLNESREFRGLAIEGLEGIDRQVQEQLRRENLALQTSLSNTVDDIRRVEEQMIVISQAHQLIAHNLMNHRDDLEQIHKQTKDTSIRISKGNTELEKAAQSGSKYRIFILIILLTISFLLLLLHHIES